MWTCPNNKDDPVRNDCSVQEETWTADEEAEKEKDEEDEEDEGEDEEQDDAGEGGGVTAQMDVDSKEEDDGDNDENTDHKFWQKLYAVDDPHRGGEPGIFLSHANMSTAVVAMKENLKHSHDKAAENQVAVLERALACA